MRCRTWRLRPCGAEVSLALKRSRTSHVLAFAAVNSHVCGPRCRFQLQQRQRKSAPSLQLHTPLAARPPCSAPRLCPRTFWRQALAVMQHGAAPARLRSIKISIGSRSTLTTELQWSYWEKCSVAGACWCTSTTALSRARARLSTCSHGKAERAPGLHSRRANHENALYKQRLLHTVSSLLRSRALHW